MSYRGSRIALSIYLFVLDLAWTGAVFGIGRSWKYVTPENAYAVLGVLTVFTLIINILLVHLIGNSYAEEQHDRLENEYLSKRATDIKACAEVLRVQEEMFRRRVALWAIALSYVWVIFQWLSGLGRRKRSN